MIMPRSAFPFQYGRAGSYGSGANLSRLGALSMGRFGGYGQDEWQPISFDPQTGAESGTGLSPEVNPPSGGGGGQIPYYLAASGTPSDQIDWSTYSPTGGGGSSVPYTAGGVGTDVGGSAGSGGAASFFTSLASGFFKSIGGQGQPVAPRPVVQAQPGVPAWAWALGAVGAVGVVAILLKK